jgi:hypothetical protein
MSAHSAHTAARAGGAVGTGSSSAIRIGLVAVTVVGLAIDAYVHLHLAWNYDPNTTAHLSQGTLFRIEGVVSIIAAVAIAGRPRWYTFVAAFAVAASALAVLLVYRYVDVGAFGPIPSMYEPVWFKDKTLGAWAEGVSALAAAALLAPVLLAPFRASSARRR